MMWKVVGNAERGHRDAVVSFSFVGDDVEIDLGHQRCHRRMFDVPADDALRVIHGVMGMTVYPSLRRASDDDVDGMGQDRAPTAPIFAVTFPLPLRQSERSAVMIVEERHHARYHGGIRPGGDSSKPTMGTFGGWSRAICAIAIIF